MVEMEKNAYFKGKSLPAIIDGLDSLVKGSEDFIKTGTYISFDKLTYN